MKKLLLVLIPVGMISARHIAPIDSPDFEFPLVAKATAPVKPKDIMKRALPMPEDLKTRIDAIVSTNKELIYDLSGADKMPYSMVIAETERDKAVMTKFSINPKKSNSNFVFTFPELPRYIVKFVRPVIRANNAAALAHKEHELNTAKNKEEYIELMKTLDHLNVDNPELHLYETYQAASVILTADRIKIAKAVYNLDLISEVKTYLYLLKPSQLPHDRNCFIVQEFLKGFPLSDADNLRKIAANPQLKEEFKRILKQLYVLIEAAKLWNVHDIFVTEDMKIAHISATPVDLEKRDRYVKNFYTEAESVNIVTDAFRNIAPLLKVVPEFFEIWQNILMQDPKMVIIMKTKPDLVQLYPKLQG